MNKDRSLSFNTNAALRHNCILLFPEQKDSKKAGLDGLHGLEGLHVVLRWNPRSKLPSAMILVGYSVCYT